MTPSTNLLVEVRPQNPRPIYVQIMDEVRRAVALGDLEQGDPLPSVRNLAAEIRVNPNTVAKAYRELESEGIVQARRGRGTFVAPTASQVDERRRLEREVARRALREAHRHGLTVADLMSVLEAEAGAARQRTVGDGSGSARTDPEEGDEPA